MATIHKTTLTPGKLELLRSWLPGQPWYQGGDPPQLSRGGGFRLDDPAGEVGIEFSVAIDRSGGLALAYLIPVTFRGAALPGADDALIGTSVHGVLGGRWIYDGSHDPVLVAALVALVQGEAEPQAAGLSDTPDHTVLSRPVTSGSLTIAGPPTVTDTADGTEVRVPTRADGPAGELTLMIHRALTPDVGHSDGQPGVSATWQQADGSQARATVISASYSPR